MNKIKLSRYLSYILRHKPEAAGITLTKDGYARVSDLIKGINNTGRYIDMDLLEEIVRTDEKGRYSFNIDKTMIRANQGHSLPVKIHFETVSPDDVPEFLLHGTSTNIKDEIYKYGIKPMTRQHVHLSADIETAETVGKRHGKPYIFQIDSRKMAKDGIPFYLSENNVWMTDYVHPKYIVCGNYY
ncbi:MAG: RNA 2'-phosphotransferase [Clostridia bacterium]|nr:RNA 2'-phosphotransferase [Clostridia bacterium]